MIPINKINRVERPQRDTEKEYEITGDGETMVILDVPGVGFDDNSSNFRGQNRQEATGTNDATAISSPKPTGDYTGETPSKEGAFKQIISNIFSSIWLKTSETEVTKTMKPDAQNQGDKKDKLESEDTKLLNEHPATSIPIIAKDIQQDIENRVLLKCLDQFAIFRSDQQYIKKKAPMHKRNDQLGFSARLNFCNFNIRLHNDECLMTADDKFVATVRVLDSELVDQSDDFTEAKKVLLQQLRIVDVLQDDLMTKKVAQENSVHEVIQTVFKDSLGNEKLTVERIQLTYLINTYDKLDFSKLCEKIKNNNLVSEKLRQTVELFLLTESRYIARQKMLAHFGYCQPARNCADSLKAMLNEYDTDYRKQLLGKAPTFLVESLSNISNDRITSVQSSDIKLFSYLEAVLNEKIFQKPLADLAARWADHVSNMNIEKLNSIEPQTNPIFYFLARSLVDLIVEISSRTSHTVKDLLLSDQSGWYPIKKITWKSENVLTQCIEREYFFIFKLLKHFDLGLCNEKKPFEYDVKLFEGSGQRSNWKKLVNDTKRLYGNEEANSPTIPDYKYVWYCLLDDVLYHSLPAEYKLDSFEQIFRGYVAFLKLAGRDALETLRVITHNTARFVVQTVPYVVQKDSSSIDGQILQKQLNLINAKSFERSLTSNSFRDLMDVFHMYWKHRNFISGIALKIYLPEMTSLKAALLEIVSVALEKNVSPEAMISFFRAYSDLLTDLNDVQFDWYIKTIPGDTMDSIVNLKMIKLIENKWTNTDSRTYSVEVVEKFAKIVPMIFDNYPRPKHYILEILLTLVSYIKQQLQKTAWSSGFPLSEMVQIETTSELIYAVRNSFLYLKEQPEYVSFQMFFDERIKPFASAVDNSRSHSDFTNRIYLMKESFWYIRKQNEIDIDKALELFADLNGGLETEVLRSAYQKYSDCFRQFMGMSDEYIAKATHIANKVKEITFVKSHQTWNSNEKLEKIPEILAGLAAVWSILVSKDVPGTGKYLTPHHIQILCILRMLSVDRAADGVVSHLSQVLSGQGKSLVMGLTATLLALTGHRPRVVCCNEYLMKRDRQNFEQFITMFDLSDSIIYSTFEDMMNDLISPVVKGERVQLRSLLEQMLLGNEQSNLNELVAEDMPNSVLLIDEVDAFFASQFYRDEHRTGIQLKLPGLDLIQQQIWNIVSQRKCRNVDEIIKDIYSYIDSEEMKREEKFHDFIASEKHCKILMLDDEKFDSDSYNNKELFDRHLKKMIKCALDVSTLPADKWNDYKLSSQGTILCKQREEFVNRDNNSYYHMFNYFRLRGSNFSTEVGSETNYGYFNLNCAIFPKSYPLILGVSGTLADFNQYEKQSIQNLYNISEMSLMPTYFGGSNLSFDQSQDFRVLASVSEWEADIFARLNDILGANRSALVFFESGLLLNSFRDEYGSQFDRLNVLTENTEPELMNQFIEDAGVAKTITLATTGMGRGVDYKSSVAIEKHGGLHVIQTFFSLDVKEETHIKGRTARKDNHGSYELITCKVHLNNAGFCEDNLTYRSLHEARLARALKDNEWFLEAINDS